MCIRDSRRDVWRPLLVHGYVRGAEAHRAGSRSRLRIIVVKLYLVGALADLSHSDVIHLPQLVGRGGEGQHLPVALIMVEKNGYRLERTALLSAQRGVGCAKKDGGQLAGDTCGPRVDLTQLHTVCGEALR